MESLAPPLECAMFLRGALENGESVVVGLRRYLDYAPRDAFAVVLKGWWFAFEQGHDRKVWVQKSGTSARRAVLDLIERGLKGQAILVSLAELETEMMEASRNEIQAHMELLPTKMLMPLMGLQLPALLILLFWPMLNRLIMELSR